MKTKAEQLPRILVFDIETAPIVGYLWGIRDQHVSLSQIKSDWHLLGWAGKWLNDPAEKTIYMDNSKAKNVQDDRALVKGLWELLNEADIVVTQNGDKFDIKKFNARAIIHGLPPPKPFRSTDIYKESKKVFGFTSHSLEYMASILNVKYKKLKHKKYPGLELWKATLAGDQDAWAEMREYCVHDVLTTDELLGKMYAWIHTHDMACYYDDASMRCRCGSKNLTKEGYARTDTGKFQVYHCKDCGKWPRSKENLLSKKKRKRLLRERK